ncbi:DAK2 domain-containing protein [Liberiplasma polymorphum]|uniref:DAK2 domain-containing protein n=1 Tax=Liberiplasma polymorphum TaxID=3374570 RepID=UPI003771CABD
MNPKELDGNLLKLIITNGSINLKNNSQIINDLNVFPVPDGDTGSNMQSTMMSGVSAISELDNESVEKIGKALSRGLLMGARGNSGVILSQLFSGFAKAFKDIVVANSTQFIEGLKLGVQQAYSAVINPVEGTILTVAREAVEKAETEVNDDMDLETVLALYLKEAEASLQRTPDLLPVLKESGVVDSGGAGLIVIIEGMLAALRGEIFEESKQKKQKHARSFDTEEVEFGYCTEFIIQLNAEKKFNKDKLVKQLSRLGDSIVVVADEEICKVHIHTVKPGDALNLGQVYGEFANLKIENMTLQHTETLLHSADAHGQHTDCGHDHGETSNISSKNFRVETRKKYGIITVVNGDGLKTMFKEMGVSQIIDGGQTMNPSTQDFIDAIDKVNADNIIIIPNNKNVMLSAEHAAKNVEDKNVIVLPAKTIAQGYASLTMFDANQELDATIEEMTELIEHVKSGEVTYAVRDTEINGLKIAKDDYIGIEDGKIVVSNPERVETVKALIKNLIDDESEIITIMYGNSVEEDEVNSLREFIEENYPSIEVETVDGKQEIYAYLLAIE